MPNLVGIGGNAMELRQEDETIQGQIGYRSAPDPISRHSLAPRIACTVGLFRRRFHAQPMTFHVNGLNHNNFLVPANSPANVTRLTMTERIPCTS